MSTHASHFYHEESLKLQIYNFMRACIILTSKSTLKNMWYIFLSRKKPIKMYTQDNFIDKDRLDG